MCNVYVCIRMNTYVYEAYDTEENYNNNIIRNMTRVLEKVEYFSNDYKSGLFRSSG